MSVSPAFPDELREFESDDVVLVEGRDDAGFVRALLMSMGHQAVQVMDYGGKTKLRRFIQAAVREPTFRRVRRLCVTRDADTSSASSFTSVRDALLSTNALAVPASPCEVVGSNPSVLVVLLPPDQAEGELEDLCVAGLEQNLMSCVDTYLQCVGPLGLIPGKVSKARVYSYLAAQHEPGMRIGESALSGAWNFNADGFRQFRDCLSLLFA